jgi:putative CocE/NonD family hydrolase
VAVSILVLTTTVLVAAGCGAIARGVAGGLGNMKSKTYMVPMRDGVKLATDVYLPEDGERYPVILVRTPYGKGHGQNFIAKLYGVRGYAMVVQDVRGRFDSGGAWEPFMNEGPDGADTVEWIRKQAWCNGKIGTFGMSYFGFTQWQAAAYAGSAVDAITPSVTGSRIYDVVYRQGAFYYLTATSWGFSNAGRRPSGNLNFSPARLFKPPLNQVDDRAIRDLEFFDQWLAHPTFDSFWKPASAEGKWDNIDAPALIVGGWYDLFSAPTLADWDKITSQGGGKARRDSRLVMGPWNHSFSTKQKGVNFGSDADFLSFSKVYGEWFDKYLKGRGDVDLPRVRVFTTGVNRWQSLSDWPPSGDRQKWYLHSGGQARGGGDGHLGPNRPSGEPEDRFNRNPENPVPTLGGALFPPEAAGPANLIKLGQRPDVLVYTSKAFDDAVEITGPIRARVWISTDRPDVDVAVFVTDVSDDGREARLLVDGIARARYRNGSREDFLSPNKPAELDIDLAGISHVLKRGHQLRIYVAGDNYPRFATNPCTEGDPASTTRYVGATIKVHHESDHPSFIEVNVRK